MKKIISTILLITVIAVFFASYISGTDSSMIYTYTDGDIEIIIEHSGLTDEQLDSIVSLFIENDSNSVASMGLMCTLFGHKMDYVVTTVIEHNYYSTAPHCRKAVYEVGECTRCGTTETTLIQETPLSCH